MPVTERGDSRGLPGLQRHQTPHSASPSLSLPLRTDWRQPGLETEVPLGLPGWPTTRTGMKLSQGDPKSG